MRRQLSLLLVGFGLLSGCAAAEASKPDLCGDNECSDDLTQKKPKGDDTALELGATQPGEIPPLNGFTVGAKIEFNETVQFETKSAAIKPASFELLHKVAEVLRANPQIIKLSVEGHTSADGTSEYNQTLSESRAAAVMKHLTGTEHIEAGRLVSKGWGETKPIAPDTAEGRIKNRRVEFLVVESTGELN